MDYEVEADKPKDWPANAREFSLEQIYKAANEFRQNPNYKSRELLLALISQHDLNQGGAYGLMRVTEYEVGIINYLYILGAMIQVNSLKVYLYELVGATTRLQKMSSWFSRIIHEESDISIKAYDEGLLLCQVLVQVKMRSLSPFNLLIAILLVWFFHTVSQSHLETYNHSDYECVLYYKKFPSIRIPNGMPDYNLGF